MSTLFRSPASLRGASNAAAATQANYQVQAGCVYRGTVLGRNDQTNLYSVQIEDPVTVLPACVFAAGLVTSLLGVRMSTRLQPGVRCLVVAGSPSFIVGCFESAPTPDAGTALDQNAKTETGSSAGTREQTGGVPLFIPNDLQEGEIEFGSLTGTALQLLTTVARIKAGDRAAVETHLQNDMVRVISGVFRHHSALGDHEIYEKDGKLHGRWSYTSLAHEAWGSISEEEHAKIAEFQVSSEAETLRSRFDMFMGHAGDFVTMVLQDPVETLGTLGAQGRPKLRMHVNPDGSFLLQGMGDIVLEHTSQIAAPFAKTAGGDEPPLTGAPNTAPLKPHDAIEDAMAEKDPIALAYALRSYSRWLTDTHSVQRFLQNPDAYGVAVQAPENPYECGEKDKKEEAPTWRPHYATVRLNRDGSVNVMSDGASVLMANGNVQVTAPKDLLLEAGGNLTLRAGRNILALARGHIEWIAVLGGIVQKCRDTWKVFSERGRLHLRTDFTEGTSNPDPDTAATITDYLTAQPGIIVEGNQTGAAMLVRTGLQLQVEDGDVSIIGTNSDRNVLRILSFKKLLTRVQDVVFRGITWSAVVERVALFGTEAVSINDKLIVEGAKPEGRGAGVVFRSMVYFRNGLRSAASIFGPQRRPIPISDGAPTGTPHLNHIQENKEPAAIHDSPFTAKAMIPNLAELATPRGGYLTGEAPLLTARIEWALLDPKAYEPTQAPMGFRSLSQEWLEAQEGKPGIPSNAVLELSEVRLLGERLPWQTPHFPSGQSWNALNSSEPVLGEPSPNAPGSQLTSEIVVVRAIAFRYTPLNP